MDTRHSPLQLSANTKQEILRTIFNSSTNEERASLFQVPSDNYLRHYARFLEKSRVTSISDSHRNITNLVGSLPVKTRKSVETQLESKVAHKELCDREAIIQDTINLAARLLLMVPIDRVFTVDRSITVSGESKLNWEADETITEVLATYFTPQTGMKEQVKLEKIFNARNLERIASVEIRWTSNLADHLRMRDDDKAVEIFHCASFLKLHQSCNKLFPPKFIHETLQTLTLLLPEHDQKVEKWFYEHQSKMEKRQKLPLDPLARECGQLKAEERQINNFRYWHDRLVILKQVFDEAEPRNIKQWWRDRRKRVQWYTFWVAALVLALTVVFGLIQSVEGGLQVWLAYQARGSH